MCTSGGPSKGGHPQHGEAAREAEKVQEVGVQEASHMYMPVGTVTGLLDATYCSPYSMLVRERKKLLLEIGATQ